MDRGIIRNEKYARNIIRFENLRWKSITPTDIDAVLDFHGKLYIFIEVKHGKTKLTTGQRILLERLSDGLQNNNTTAVSIVCQHYFSGDVKLEGCIVRKIYYLGKWHSYGNGLTVSEAIEKLRHKHL